MGTEFQSRKVKIQMGDVELQNNVNVLHVTELYS